MNPSNSLHRGGALLIVDVQNDFCPGGALPIAAGDEIIPVLTEWIEAAISLNVPVYASRDWHPVGHVSFREAGGPWPPHCIQDTKGAQFRWDLHLPNDTMKITKGVRFDHDQNSAFDDTGLAHHLRARGIKRLWIGGLAQDVCVLATVLDALNEQFEVLLIRAATRGISESSCADADQRMRQAGAQFV
jgi:nicotinamidase/pyrazinamidase